MDSKKLDIIKVGSIVEIIKISQTKKHMSRIVGQLNNGAWILIREFDTDLVIATPISDVILTHLSMFCWFNFQSFRKG